MTNKSTCSFYLLVIIAVLTSLVFFDWIGNTASAQNVTNSTVSPSVSTSPPSLVKPLGKFLTYSNPSYGIKMQFPSNWVVSRNGLKDYSQIVGFYSPLQNVSDLIPEHVTLSATVYSKNITLNQYNDVVNGIIGQLGVKVLNSTSTLLAGKPAQMLLFSIKSGRTGLTSNNMLVYTVNGNIEYTISVSSPSAKFTHYLPVVQKMLNSFEIRNSTSFR